MTIDDIEKEWANRARRFLKAELKRAENQLCGTCQAAQCKGLSGNRGVYYKQARARDIRRDVFLASLAEIGCEIVRLRRCLILLPLLVSAATSAKSNDPSPSPSEIRKPEQSKPSEPKAPAQKKSGSHRSTSFDNQRGASQPSSKRSAENAKEADSKTATDWWMVWLTGILAFVAFLQLIVFGLQARRLRQTIETMEKIGTDQSKDMQGWIAVAKESADAAKKSADVAAGYSRPMLFVSEIYFQEGQVRVDGLSLRAKIVVEIKNFGETPAFLRRSCVDIAVGVQEGYLDVLTHKTGEAVESDGAIFSSRRGLQICFRMTLLSTK